MKVSEAALILVTASACGRDQKPVPPNAASTVAPKQEVSCGLSGPAILTDDGIGSLREGRTVESVNQSCSVVSDTLQLGTEGMKERVLAVDIAGEVVRATVVNGRISRIAVSSPAIRTLDSVGVDTPLRKIAAMRGAQFFPGEDGVYAFVSDHCAMSFRFSLPLRPPTGGQWTSAAISEAHGDAVVDRVLVTRCRN